MRRLIASALLAVLVAIIGPRIVGPQSHAAGAPFVFEPPEGFVQAKDSKIAVAEGAQVWVFDGADRNDGGGYPADRTAVAARIVLNHSSKEMSVEETDLSRLAREMPTAFEGSCTWVHRRHEMRARFDGARVGLIEGDCDREIDLGSLGLPAQTLRSRKLQLMFPDDSGTSIVTASYPADQAVRWEPLFEATIGKARGVATRAPVPAPWTYAVWGAAGAVLGWLATAIVQRKGSEPEPSKRPAHRSPREKKHEEEVDDENEEEDEK